MLTIIRKLKLFYLKLIFDYYGKLADEYIKKLKECVECNDPNAQYWEIKTLAVIRKRQAVLRERLELRGLG